MRTPLREARMSGRELTVTEAMAACQQAPYPWRGSPAKTKGPEDWGPSPSFRALTPAVRRALETLPAADVQTGKENPGPAFTDAIRCRMDSWPGQRMQR